MLNAVQQDTVNKGHIGIKSTVPCKGRLSLKINQIDVLCTETVLTSETPLSDVLMYCQPVPWPSVPSGLLSAGEDVHWWHDGLHFFGPRPS